MSDVDIRIFFLWFLAVSDAQKSGDLGPLVKLLRSEIEMPQKVREMLAELLGRRRLKRKAKGGQLTPMFQLSAKERFARAASLVRRFEQGQAASITDLFNDLPREQLARLRRGEAIGLTHAMLSKQPKRMSRTEAINKVAGLNGIDAQQLANYVDGKIGFGRKKRASVKPPVRLRMRIGGRLRHR
jgi:hypothetical protein